MVSEFDPADFWERFCTAGDPDRYSFHEEPRQTEDGHDRLLMFLLTRWAAMGSEAVKARVHPGSGARGTSESALGYIILSKLGLGGDPARCERVARLVLAQRARFQALGDAAGFYFLLDDLGYRHLAEPCLADEPDHAVHEQWVKWAHLPGPTQDRMYAVTNGDATLPPDAPDSLLAAYREVRRLIDGATKTCGKCGLEVRELGMYGEMCQDCYAINWDESFSSHSERADVEIAEREAAQRQSNAEPPAPADPDGSSDPSDSPAA